MSSGLPAKAEKTLIRRIAIPGGVKRQHLPQLLSGIGQEVGELERATTQVAHAAMAGK